jgi:hypothetical protein
MAQLTHQQYEALERAVIDGTRVAVRRRGRREHIVIPTRIYLRDGRETIEARNATTGREMTIWIDEVEALEVVR